MRTAINIPTRRANHLVRECDGCANLFIQRHAAQRYCCPQCRRSLETLLSSRRNYKPEAEPGQRKMRTCLWCDQRFVSQGPGNRKCKDCRGRISTGTKWTQKAFRAQLGAYADEVDLPILRLGIRANARWREED